MNLLDYLCQVFDFVSCCEAQVWQGVFLLLILVLREEFPLLGLLSINHFFRVIFLIEVKKTGGFWILGVHRLDFFLLAE